MRKRGIVLEVVMDMCRIVYMLHQHTNSLSFVMHSSRDVRYIEVVHVYDCYGAVYMIVMFVILRLYMYMIVTELFI